MNILLCALSHELLEAWSHAFADVDQVQCRQGSILEASTDAIVSPANSFGYMDGGIDLVYSQFFGWQVEERVRAVILQEHDGELPVGNAIVVPTDSDRFPWMISAPTMRVPMRVETTANAALAFRAVLRAARRHNQGEAASISSIACPGLGTGEGRMPADRCAAQMRYAWDVVMDGRAQRMGGLAGAVRSHMKLVGAE